jgi:fatty-acyl-CoA synthase
MDNNNRSMHQLLIGEVVSRNARKFPGKTALLWEGGRLTYDAFNRRINSLANALLGLGIKRGEKVALLLANGPEILETAFALFKIGSVAVPLNFRLAGKEIEYIVNNSDAKILVVGQEFVPAVQGIRDSLHQIQEFIAVCKEAPEGMTSYNDLILSSNDQDPATFIDDDDDALILYTSGTTGRPKGAVMTHKSFLMNAINWVVAYHTGYNDMLLCIPPLFHVAALGYALTHFYMGASIYIEKMFDPQRTYEIITKEHITTLFLVPAMWIALLQVENKENYNTSSMRILNTGASIMPVEIKSQVLATFPNAGIFDCFGQTEMNGGVTILDARDALKKPGSVGLAVPNLEIRLVDELGRDVLPGDIGEGIYRGPTVMKSYYQNPSATAEAMKDGWFHSGDLLRQDSEGYYYVVDRKKDMLISGGENIYPAEIEEVLYQHPDILEAAVIGVPDPRWGESVQAFVVPKPGKSLTPELIIQHCKTYLASYKKPKSVTFIDALPRSVAGKVLKRVLRDQYGKE